jgi:hypothetical protein
MPLLHPARCPQVGKIIGEKWKALDEEEKKPYQDMAEKDKASDLGL